MLTMEKVYVLGGLRTPIVVKNGQFKNIKPECFGAEVLKALIKKYALTDISGVIAGNAVGTGGNITRLMTLTAGIDERVPAMTVDVQCASAAAAISVAYAKIAAGQGDVFIAGGLESSSLQPIRVYAKGDDRYDKTPMHDGAYKTAQFSPGDLNPDAMLRGAEKTAQAENITKEELDAWVLESHRRASDAQTAGVLSDIIVPVNGCEMDDGIRPRMNQRLLDRLPLIFGKGSLTNAGNSCLINDGAAFVVLVSEKYLAKHKIKPAARILGTASMGGVPDESPRGAMRTADTLLSKLGLGYEDLSAIEFNEAFAVIDVLFERSHPSLRGIYNTFGGALAYGHPYGASGAILMLHLLKALSSAGGGKGILSIAGAGGMGEAIGVEML